jgi:hypothetical protein
VSADPRATARWAAALYVLSAVPAAFSVFVLRGLLVSRDPAATAARILGSEARFRLGDAAEIVGILLVVASVLLLQSLFRPVSRRLSLLMAVFGWVGCAIQAFDTLADTAALMLLHGGAGVAALPVAQAQVLAYYAVRMHASVYNLAFAFFGVFAVLAGRLVLGSTFVPRIFGVLLAIDGLGYFTFSLATFLSPATAAHMQPLVPFGTAILGEGSFMLWLLVRGVDASRWEEQAAAAR